MTLTARSDVRCPIDDVTASADRLAAALGVPAAVDAARNHPPAPRLG